MAMVQRWSNTTKHFMIVLSFERRQSEPVLFILGIHGRSLHLSTKHRHPTLYGRRVHKAALVQQVIDHAVQV